MPTPRSQLVCLQATRYYHCVSRCVRGAYLCGDHQFEQKNFDHRRAWIEQRILLLAEVFCMDVCAYAVMSNHFHIVVGINERKAKSLSYLQIAQRWHRVCKGTLQSQQFVQQETNESELDERLKETLDLYRRRLMDLSWFMRMLNEPIARMANQEDNCTGHFWKGRFYSQALLDETALLSCMAYVDLNPVRAGIANTPEKSDHTSALLRIEAARKQHQPKALYPFIGNQRKGMPDGLPFHLQEYLSILDMTGRCVREDKIGFIDDKHPAILNRLGISSQSWHKLTTAFEQSFPGIAGNCASLNNLIAISFRKRRCNVTSSQRLFGYMANLSVKL